MHHYPVTFLTRTGIIARIGGRDAEAEARPGRHWPITGHINATVVLGGRATPRCAGASPDAQHHGRLPRDGPHCCYVEAADHPSHVGKTGSYRPIDHDLRWQPRPIFRRWFEVDPHGDTRVQIGRDRHHRCVRTDRRTGLRAPQPRAAPCHVVRGPTTTVPRRMAPGSTATQEFARRAP
jgi:hypothetical protein